MKALEVIKVVDGLLTDNRLWLPSLSDRIGFSSSRVEWLLQSLVGALPSDEMYLEVGVLNGRTLESAAYMNSGAVMVGVDPGSKYGSDPIPPEGTILLRKKWEELCLADLPLPIGLTFYDGDHSERSTSEFMSWLTSVNAHYLADEAILILDDWDRQSVRSGAWKQWERGHWELIRELPSYTNGEGQPNHFGWYYGISIWSYRRRF